MNVARNPIIVGSHDTDPWYQALLSLLLVCLATGHARCADSPPSRRLSVVAPAAAGMSAERLSAIDGVVSEALAQQRMPGCVVAVGRRGKLVFLKSYGCRQVRPKEVPMTTDTIFDLASLTKPLATATSVMQLVERGKIQLHDRVATYLPDFAPHGKNRITVYHLLTHQGGLTPDNALSDYRDGPEKSWQRICALELRSAPGSKFIYSDVGYIVLGKLVERITGERLDVYARESIYASLGMRETGFLPAEDLRARSATTEQREGRWMQGEVHDPRAYLLEGVAGHAGLFSSAEDLALYADMMLRRGRAAGRQILAWRTIDRMTDAYPVQHASGKPGLRGLGWDKQSGYSSNRSDLYSRRAFGHGGFTGTAMWIDPGLDLFVIFLSNRVHPDGKGSVNPLAGRIGSIAAAAITDPDSLIPQKEAHCTDGDTLCGIDVLRRDGFRLLEGKRVGLITNQTGEARDGASTIQLLHQSPRVQLVKLFSPEHGIAGVLDVPEIRDSQDPNTGVRIVSLYGDSRKPSSEELSDIDVLVFDIQDIGTRFYTYISTMGNAMLAAAENDVEFVVLDRPNPINGVDVEGPVLDAGRESFVGWHPIPVRHGMTVGELAQLFRHERKMDLDLQVVRVENWRRADYYDRTGLLWINPSPNMRNGNQALLYPGIGLLETTNLSVGRGTDTPFEVLGAPWLDGPQLARQLNAAGLKGVRFIPLRFTPDASKFAGEACSGISIVITARRSIAPLRVGLEIAHQLRKLHPDDWNVEAYDRLLCNSSTWEAVVAGKSVDEIQSLYHPELERFLVRRAAWLMYQ